ncbi:MAG: 16S rRNA (guanine(966)-N(2))-methyltransferase RsmD [Oscillospiraceae bacterium]|jgi:16S rRNA (guanine(966)-N(2))-methyltransferase RsmD|nr:16S rRNA (guanine(966)-N(2))-methyltransferase RsmD [Oscillospiraceae bacterium]
MRVISGAARGRRLGEPKDRDIRPTADRVKESIFNILQFDLEGRRALDLFAGTGQLGIEALSRGVRHVTFVDESAEAVRLIRDNLALCRLQGEVIRGDARAFLAQSGKYDVIFLDPPYKSGLIDTVLRQIIQFDILSDGGIIICETGLDAELPALSAPYFKGREYKYGKVRLTVFGRGEREG